MRELSNFSGVWKRTKLFEPIGELGPEEEQLKDVIWIQAKRVATFNAPISHFTWEREFDFRAPGSPDIGLIRLLEGTPTDPLQIEEDGVLPGDDYMEIWDRVAGGPAASNDCTARLLKKDANGVIVKKGLFLVVGNWFALTISRSLDDNRSRQEAELKRIFDESEREPSAAASDYLWEYLCVVGSTNTWKIEFALHPELRQSSILPNRVSHPELMSLLVPLSSAAKFAEEGNFEQRGLWEWVVLDGAIPSELRNAAK